MVVEIERKFLVDKNKWKAAEKGKGNFYRQGYMHSDAFKTIRVRLTDTEGFITIKGPAAGLSRPEYEYTIPQTDAQELLDNFCGAIVSKYRYKVQYDNNVWEVDEFLDNNTGLLIAEIELSNEAAVFKVPDWVESEVTGDKRYSNSQLAVHPFLQWKDNKVE